MSILSSQRTSYAKLLSNETLNTVLGAFRGLHPDVLPIVVYRVLDESWFGELTEPQVRQALRDAYDLAERGLARDGELQSPSGFVAAKVRLALENQVLMVRIAPEGTPEPSDIELHPVLQETTEPFLLMA